MSAINLSAGVRSNLLSLQGTADLLNRTNERLATGLKVNSPLDDAGAFFTARGLSNRANDLSSLTQGMQNGMQTLKAASKGLESMTKTIEGMTGLLRQARADASSTETTNNGTATFTVDPAEDFTLGGVTLANANITDRDDVIEFINNNTTELDGVTAAIDPDVPGGIIITNTTETALTGGSVEVDAATTTSDGLSDIRRSLMNSFEEMRAELNNIARDSGFNGVNLLNGDNLELIFNELSGPQRSELTLQARGSDGEGFGPINADSLEIGLGDLEAVFGSNGSLDDEIQSLQAALGQVRTISQQLGTSQTVVENRLNFTNAMINTLKEGSDNLILADMNEEAANSLALQTKQQLGQSALGLATRTDQAVLQLLR